MLGELLTGIIGQQGTQDGGKSLNLGKCSESERQISSSQPIDALAFKVHVIWSGIEFVMNCSMHHKTKIYVK